MASRVPVSQLTAEELEHKHNLNRKHTVTFTMKRELAEANQERAHSDQEASTLRSDNNGVSNTTDIDRLGPLKIRMNFNTSEQTSRIIM